MSELYRRSDSVRLQAFNRKATSKAYACHRISTAISGIQSRNLMATAIVGTIRHRSGHPHDCFQTLGLLSQQKIN